MVIKIVLLVYLFNYITSIMVKVNGKKEYCFSKTYNTKAEIKISYAISSETNENMQVTIVKDKKETYYNITHTGEKNNTQSGLKTLMIEEGFIELCFMPYTQNIYYVSFDIIESFGNEIFNNLGTDESMKDLLKEVKNVKNVFDDLERALKTTSDGKYSHFKILDDIIKSLKRLTYLKIFIYFAFSLLQGYIIIKFFGPDKRVTNLAGAFSDRGL